jgi:hypothetical protein
MLSKLFFHLQIAVVSSPAFLTPVQAQRPVVLTLVVLFCNSFAIFIALGSSFLGTSSPSSSALDLHYATRNLFLTMHAEAISFLLQELNHLPGRLVISGIHNIRM